MEYNEKTDLWIDLPTNTTVTFWPETNSMQMYVKYWDSTLHSQAFYISTVHQTVLRMDKGVIRLMANKICPYIPPVYRQQFLLKLVVEKLLHSK